MYVLINFWMHFSFSPLLNILLTIQVTNMIILIISQLQFDTLLSLPLVSDLSNGNVT